MEPRLLGTVAFDEEGAVVAEDLIVHGLQRPNNLRLWTVPLRRATTSMALRPQG